MTVTFALHHISQRITCRSNGASRQVNNQPGGSDPGRFSLAVPQDRIRLDGEDRTPIR